jgi:hypothetical protein
VGTKGDKLCNTQLSLQLIITSNMYIWQFRFYHAERNNQKGKAASAAACVLGPQNKIPYQETDKLKSGNYPKFTHKALTQ